MKSRQRLALLDRVAVVSRAKAEALAVEAKALQRDLRAIADAVQGSQRSGIEAMIGHAHTLEQRYTEASTPEEEQ